MRIYTRRPLADRFWEKVDRRGPDECWPWRGGLFPSGYGSLAAAPKGTLYAHRVAYELARGPIPEGLTVDHMCHRLPCPGGRSCRHRRCVNPGHLQLLPNERNVELGQSPPARNARKTHCIHGHEFTEENTYRDPTHGYRTCRTCAVWREQNRPKR